MTVTVGTGGTSSSPLVGCDLEVGAGDVVSVSGPSGSGKTTLLRAIAGDAPLARGTIEVCGWTAGSHQARQITSTLPQAFDLVSFLTAIQNVALLLRRRGAGRAEAQQTAGHWLEVLGIAELSGRLPHELSGGQQQRVALARALAHGPALLLADEPTAALDRSTADEAITVVIGAARQTGTAVIFATHDPVVAEQADAAYVVEDHRLVAVAPRPQ